MDVRTLLPIALAATLVAPPVTAEEAPPQDEGPTFGIGARVGGYGFREVRDDKLSWQDCRMNGTGVFATLDFTRHFFGEVSADLYHATAGPVSGGMDRSSFHTLAAVGARLLPDYFLTPFIQAGAGPEFTRIDVGEASDRFVLPEAFMGVGGELNWKSFHFGSTLRVATMGLPVHDHGTTTSGSGTVHQHLESEEQGIEVRQQAAGHVLFTVRYTF